MNRRGASELFWIFIGSIAVGIAIRTMMNVANWWPHFFVSGIIFGMIVGITLNFFHRSFLIYFFILCFGFSFGWWRSDVIMDRTWRSELDDFYEESVTIIGYVNREPDVRSTNTKLQISVSEICRHDFCTQTLHKILVSVTSGTDVLYGDLVWVSGKLKVPENFVSESGREFDYVNYLAKDQIRGLISFPEFEVMDRGYGSPVWSRLIEFKSRLVGGLEKVMPQPHGALGAGIVFGEKQALSVDLRDQFRRTGLMHIVVLSGYNVTIVADSLVRVLSFLGRRLSLGFGITGIVFFALMVGAGPTVIRASIMAGLVLVARYSGRGVLASRSLLLAGVIMLMQNPLVLWYDISFQLSFLATLGLIYLSPYIVRWLSFIPDKFQLREHATATVSAQIAVTPLLLSSMGELSVISPIANLLVLPVIPLGMLLTFITSVLGVLFAPIAGIVMLPTAGLLQYVLWITEQLSKLPFAVVQF